jgi:hypothetical protein
MVMSWKLTPEVISSFNTATLEVAQNNWSKTVQDIVITTTDGMFPVATNIDFTRTYVEFTDSTKLFFENVIFSGSLGISDYPADPGNTNLYLKIPAGAGLSFYTVLNGEQTAAFSLQSQGFGPGTLRGTISIQEGADYRAATLELLPNSFDRSEFPYSSLVTIGQELYFITLAGFDPEAVQPPGTTATFYYPSSVIDVLNSGTLLDDYGNGTSSYNSIKGNIKLAKVQFTNFDPSQLGGGTFFTVSPTETYIELLDGTKYYMGETGYSVGLTASVNGNGDLEIIPESGFNFSVYQFSTIPYCEIGLYEDSTVYFGFDLTSAIQGVQLGYFPLTDGKLVLSSTVQTGTGGGGGGGGDQPSGPGMYDGKVIMTVEADPTQTEVLYDNQPLPEGSIVKLSATGQKFVKLSGESTAFQAIEIVPPAEWNWNQEGVDAWADLQSFWI